MITETPGFDDALARWLERAQTLVTDYYAKHFPNVRPRQLSVDPGGVRYVRIVAVDSGESRSAYAFIERATGAVLKPDGWKRPAKGIRGSIYTDALGVGPTGALYR